MIRGAIDHLTGAWAFIQDVQQRGLVAIWEYVTDQLSGLWHSSSRWLRSGSRRRSSTTSSRG